MAVEILFEDGHLLAVSKPSGQLVIPGRGELPGEPLSKELERQRGRKVYVVHRLDRGASGIVLFAKDAPTHRRLCLQFENREVEKSYQVLVQGVLDADGRVDQPLRAFGSGRMGFHKEGKPSETHYSILKKHSTATLLKVTPVTGRRHQIRVHLYSIGHPVMGDTLYGKDRPVGGAMRLMLHAWTLNFEDAEGQPRSLRAEPPNDFIDVLRRF